VKRVQSLCVRAAAAGLAVLLALATAACGALFGGKERTPVAIYVLALDRSDAPVSPGACGTLEVSMPSSAPGFSTARMVYQREANHLEAFAYSRWAETPAQMVQAVMIDALQRSGIFAAALPAPAAVRPDFTLQGDALSVLQRFESGASTVDVSLDVQLVDEHRGRLLAAQRLSARVSADARPQAGVDAANRALAQLVQELVELTRRSIDCASVPAAD
jgi:ABC-type uncharacterized transport system auxiliary subunit